MKKHCRGIIYGLLCVWFNSHAIFLSLYEYKHPVTGQRVLLCGDIHCDIDAAGTLSRIQKNAVLQEAKKRNAFFIAENIFVPGYNPEKWASLMGLNGFVFAKALCEKKYYDLLGPVVGGAFVAKAWYNQWKFHQVPTVSFEAHLKPFNGLSENQHIPLFGHSPLMRIVQDARALGLTTADPEFRCHFYTAYYEYLKTINSSWLVKFGLSCAQAGHWCMRKVTRNKQRFPLTVADYWHTHNALIATIESYMGKDKKYDDFYRHCMSAYNSSYIVTALREQQYKNPRCSLKRFIKQYVKTSKKEYKSVIMDFIEHNKNLLDALIAHTMYQQSNTKEIVICTGVAHTVELVKLIESLGYTQVGVLGKDNWAALVEKDIVYKSTISKQDLSHIALDIPAYFNS